MTNRWNSSLLPQIGAVLHLDTEIPNGKAGSIEKGNKHWTLDGSCVLVAPDRVLGTTHTFLKPGLQAIFLPGEGIFPTSGEPIPDWLWGDTARETLERQRLIQSREYLDYLVLVNLEEPVRQTPPLSWLWARPRSSIQECRVAGYGRWRDMKGILEDGIQRIALVNLAKSHGDKLDLDWLSDMNEGLEALRNNSGGPLLLRDGSSPDAVIGLSRERARKASGGILQAASRIAEIRDKGLGREIGEQSYGEEPDRVAWRNLEIEAIGSAAVQPPGLAESFPVPDWAHRGTARVTLSATPGLRLQMGLTQTEDPAALLARLASDNLCAGRFLVRPRTDEEHQLGDSDHLTVAVTPVRGAPQKAPSVEAQLCVRFSPPA